MDEEEDARAGLEPATLLLDEALEPVRLKRRKCVLGADELEPRPRRVRMRCVGHHGGAVLGDRVDVGRNIDTADRVSDLLLKDRLRLPGDSRLDQMAA